jgi:acetyltransferase-like isoleucine patch superfamily enzyme
MFASGVTILDHDHDFSNPLDPLQCAEGLVAAPTVIEDNVFLGDHVVVLKGVRIGNGSVIGANSVVTHDIPRNVPCETGRPPQSGERVGQVGDIAARGVRQFSGQ